MKKLELFLTEVDYLKPSRDGYVIYLSGQLFRGKPIGIWKKIDNGIVISGSYSELVNEEKLHE